VKVLQPEGEDVSERGVLGGGVGGEPAEDERGGDLYLVGVAVWAGALQKLISRPF
jgi:hypothetical protein